MATDEAPSADRSQSSNRYDPARIEPRWQRYWEENQTFRAVRHPGRPKHYVLDMFPYPSGAGLHVGHPEGYTATDIVSRFKRMCGVDVLHPMGWDAFGLPAEQHAILTGTHPRETTKANIATFKRQLKELGFSYDWSRELDTTDTGYVRWTQWIFLQLFKKGLAFQSEIPVNWCAELGTVLANEEVIDGKSERGGYPVERLPLRQWMLKITAYADRLDADLDGLDWPDTKAKQHHWIGRSEGAEIDFAVEGHDGVRLTVFTTRPDTLPGVTYVVLAPEHALVEQLTTASQRAAVQAYAEQARAKSEIDRTDVSKKKTGVPTGAFVRNPLTGERVPLWVADYAIATYGTGAVMAVPAHDDRDHAFAKTYDLPIVQVVAPLPGARALNLDREPFTDDGVAKGVQGKLAIADGTASIEVRRLVTDWLTEQGSGRARVTYRLRDWVFSRQRYWGEPIPIYFPVYSDAQKTPLAFDPTKQDGVMHIAYDDPRAVDEAELPLVLPELADFKPSGDAIGPLGRARDWRFFQRDGQWFARETNTMPQWAGSCWYYLRFLDPRNDERIFSEESYDAWMPVDLYVGGSEHAVLHLLYARFWHKVLFDIGVVKHAEPFGQLVHQGLILGEMEYTSFWDRAGNPVDASHARSISDTGWEDSRDASPLTTRKENVLELQKRGGFFYLSGDAQVRVAAHTFKMSKSRGNVINPDDIIRASGADSLRVYEMFMGPLTDVKPWQTSGIEGVRRFLDRVWNVATGPVTDDAAAYDAETKKLVHKTVKKVTEDIEHMRFNTAVSAMMILVKHLGALATVPREAVRALTLIVSPFAPHLAEELWREVLGNADTLAYEPWPTFDPALVVDDVIAIGVQVNGKVRGSVTLAVAASEADARSAATAETNIAAHLEGKTVKKVVYVPGKILNFIVG